MDWGTYLTTSESVIYAVIDGRGSGYRGNDLLHEIYYKLGQPEVQDQIDVTKRLVDQYAFIDASNVAIWGWSYGGKNTNVKLYFHITIIYIPALECVKIGLNYFFFLIGFVTTSVLAADADQDNVFKCGIAVAPVTNWIYYDTIYTERYMGLPTPEDNSAAYRASDVTAKAEKLRNKKLLLVHGTAGICF